jgi:hypothetical protein
MKPNQGQRIFADLKWELGVWRERERERERGTGANTTGETGRAKKRGG